MLKKLIPILRILAVLLVIALAWNLRLNAATYLPVDYDEDDYLRAAQEYAAVIRSGDLTGLMDYNYRPEHPPLLKILYGWAIAGDKEVRLIPDRGTSAPPDPTLPRPHLIHARTLGAVIGTLVVGIVALINPLAGFALSIHTFNIKYVSQVMLDSLPSLTSLITVLAYLKSKNSTRRWNWLALSALFLGLTASSKYLYCVVGIAILIDWFLGMPFPKFPGWGKLGEAGKDLRRYAPMLLWGLIAVLVFFATNPYLWPDPINRLQESVFYHAGYASGAVEVQNAGHPFYQSLVYLTFSPYWWWQNGVFIFPFDPFIAIFAAFGLKRLWKKERLYVLWMIVALAFLFVWPTKWAQYNIMYSVPLALSAAEGFMALIVDPLKAWWVNRKDKAMHAAPQKNELRRAWAWLIPGLIAFLVLTLFPLVFQLGVSFTDFSVASIRDGLQGGLWRAIFGGLTGGQGSVTSPEFPYRATQVNFIGPINFLPVLGYISDRGILTFNILWTIFSVILQSALGLGIALLLWQRGVRLGKFWQALFIVPWAIPEMIGALMWVNIFQPERGWLALAVKDFGPNIPFGFLVGWENSADLWILVFLIPAVWYGFPFMMMAASAGLKMIPDEVYDAAAMDGATSLQIFRYITWPLLLPLLLPAIIVRGIFAFNQFYLFQAFFAFEGTLATMAYNIFNSGGFHPLGGQFAISSVVNVLTVLILIGFVIIFNRWSKASEGVTYA